MRNTADFSLQEDDLITLSAQSASGEEVATVCADGSWTVRHLVRKITEVAPIRSDKRYVLLWEEAILPFDCVLRYYGKVFVVPVKHLEFCAAKFDVSLREALLWATLAMHTMLSRMVMFHCTICNERFPTFLPAYRLPDELDLDFLGRPRTCKGKTRLPPCCIDLATWDEAPPLEVLEEEAIVVREYMGCCLRCHRDVRNELQKLQQVDPNAVAHDVIPLRGWQNRIHPCYRFPWHDLADLFASATVTEARFIALEHMQIDSVIVSSTGLRKFRKNIISFPQSVVRAVRRHRLLTQNVRHGDSIEGLEVRWNLVWRLLKVLTALPHLYPHVTCGLLWRFGGSLDEPMCRWYDPKHGMFDVLDEADMRRYCATVLRAEVVGGMEEGNEISWHIARFFDYLVQSVEVDVQVAIAHMILCQLRRQQAPVYGIKAIWSLIFRFLGFHPYQKLLPNHMSRRYPNR